MNVALNRKLEDSPFLLACHRKPVPHTPIWLMRQAGRYMPAYRAIREKYHSMLELCKNADLVTQVTHLPIQQFGFDAAILFSDITMPFIGLDLPFDIKPGVGPVMKTPLRSLADVEKLRPFDIEEKLPFIPQAVKNLSESLPVPLIGFAGAPYTLAAYMIEGKPSRDFKMVRKFIYTEPEAWNKLMEVLVDVTVQYLHAQAEAGASALQIFDSWVGGLPLEVYREHLLPHMQRLFQALTPLNIPLIHFGTGTALLLPLMKQAGGDVIGIDWKTPMAFAKEILGDDVALQGNLDPTVLLAPFQQIQKETDLILSEMRDRPGHIFNLGHGILPETPEENVARLVAYVREQTQS